MSAQNELRDLIARVPETIRWKVYKEIDFENKNIRGQTIPQHLGRIADGMIDWQLAVADQLKLSKADRADIVAKHLMNPGLQRREALTIWKSRLGTKATYEALMKVFVEANKVEYAEIIVGILSEGANATQDEPITSVATAVGSQLGPSPRAGVQASGGARASGGAQGTAAIPQNTAAHDQVPSPSTIATDGGSLSFSPNMKPGELNQWLLQEYSGDYHKDSIDQLKQMGIDGEIFLMLPEDKELLESLKLPHLFKTLIVKKAKAQKESTTAPSSGEANLPGPPSNEVPIVPQIFECGTADLDVPTFTADSASPGSHDGELSAWVPENVIWPKGKTVLQVKFLNDIPTNWMYDKGGLNRGNIKQWANIWSNRGDGIIPLFKFVDGTATSDIRVKFVDNEASRSKVGRKAQDQAQDKPTMWLNLRSGGDDYKEHVVVHEFGHALGLGHEHQRSDFWKRVKSYINVDAIKADVGEASFKVNWGKDSDYKRKNATSYDPLSIMHYPFKKEWLKSEYSDEMKVEDALREEYIGKKVADVLRGILERAKNPYITEPSTEDINLLKELYSQGSSKGGCTIQAPPSRVVPDSPIIIDTAPISNQRDPLNPAGAAALPLATNTEFDSFEVQSRFVSRLEWKDLTTDESKYVKVYKDAAPKWDQVAQCLGFEPSHIESVRQNYHTDEMRVTNVFSHWFDNANNLPNSKKYPKKWSGLIRLLNDSDLGQLSEKVRKALSAPYSDVRDNLY